MSSPREEFIDWKRRDSAIACVFARLLAGKPEVDGFAVETVDASKPEVMVAKNIDSLVTKAVNSASTTSLTLILAQLDDIEKWARIAHLLSQYDSWELTEVPFEDDALSFAQLTRQLTRSDGINIPSESLFLGPFDFFPNTRRSPHSALELYVGTPRSTDAVSGLPTERANLAHIDARLPTQGVFDRMVRITGELRKQSLGLQDGEDDLRAKAKVSFVLPKDLAKKVGLFDA